MSIVVAHTSQILMELKQERAASAEEARGGASFCVVKNCCFDLNHRNGITLCRLLFVTSEQGSVAADADF